MQEIFESPEFVASLIQEYDRRPVANPDHPVHLVNLVKGWDQPDLSVLDVGCGYGRMRRLWKHAKYLGVDDSSEMVRRCKEIGIPVQKESIYSLSFDDREFDVVASSSVLFHIGHVPRAVRELWRVTREVLVFSCFWSIMPKLGYGGVKPVFFDNPDTGVAVWSPCNEIWFPQLIKTIRSLKPKRYRIRWIYRGVFPCSRIALVKIER